MKNILVETSARHIHVTQETLEILCGKGFQLEVRANLSQPGQFVSNTRLDIVGPVNPKTGLPRVIKGVSILGPVRKVNQVEVSATDARTLGCKAVIRESGDVKGSSPIKLVGPCGEVELAEGLIVAKRHVHMTEEDAKEFNVTNGEIVKIKINSPMGRNLIFDDVVIRVNPNFKLAMHIDTDEANAAGCAGEMFGELVK